MTRSQMTTGAAEGRPRRPVDRRGFDIAIICALTLEADAVDALFDIHWDDDGGIPFDKTPGDPNAYSAGAIGRHNVVLAHMPGMGKASAALVANNCRFSFPNIKLALVVGVCGAVPLGPCNEEIILGDVIISDGVIQYDLGQQLPGNFVRTDTLLDSLGRPNFEIRTTLAKLKTLRCRRQVGAKIATYLSTLRKEPLLAAQYPGVVHDRLFQATYHHLGSGRTCEQAGCDGELVARQRLLAGSDPEPAVHFGLTGSGDLVMKSGEDRDAIATKEGIIAFEMESAGVWDALPCVVIKGVCDYADSHKNTLWQPYAAATSAACTKAFLGEFMPSFHDFGNGTLPGASDDSSYTARASELPTGPYCEQAIQKSNKILAFLTLEIVLLRYPKNESFIGRMEILEKLQAKLQKSSSQTRVALFGLGGIGKTQIAIAYAYWLHEMCPDVSIFWVQANNSERFRQAYTAIAQECHIPGFEDSKADVLTLVKDWLERTYKGRWLLVIDNADDKLVFSKSGDKTHESNTKNGGYLQFIPESSHGSILVTTRNKQVGYLLTKNRDGIEVGRMDEPESDLLVRSKVDGLEVTANEVALLCCRLEYIPLALVHAASYIRINTMTVTQYLQILDKSNQNLIELLSRPFETEDSETVQAVAATWMVSFKQMERENVIASKLLSVMSFLDRQAIPKESLIYYIRRWQIPKHGMKQFEDQSGEIQLEDALGLLKAYFFISAERDDHFSIHRLIQLVTRKWLAGDGTLDQFAHQALVTVSELYPYGAFENRVACNDYLPHVFAILQFEGIITKSGKTQNARLPSKTSLLRNVAGLLLYWKKSRDKKTKLAAIATLLQKAATFFLYQGKWKYAEEFLLMAVDMQREASGHKHLSTILIMQSLAESYREQRRWEEAEFLQKQVMEGMKRQLGREHDDTITSMAHLSLIYSSQGQLEEAESLQIQVIESSKQAVGEEDPNTLTAMENLASTYSKQGRWREAVSLQVRVMEATQRVLGHEHPNTLRSIVNLAAAYEKQGRWTEAESLEIQAMKMALRVLGQNHPRTLDIMSRLARTYTKQDRWEEAKGLQEQVMEATQRLLGEEHP